MRSTCSFTALTLTVSFGLSLCAASLGANCVSSKRDSGDTVGYDKIQIVFDSSASDTQKQSFRQGMAAWNSSSCNSSGTDFPRFQESSAGAGRTITVSMLAGKNPDNPNSCGRFIGNNILMYEKVQTSAGTQDCYTANVLQDNAVHELGHVLGLNDSTCSGYGMSQTQFTPSASYVDRVLRGSECSIVEDTNQTPTEQFIDLCATSPDDPMCNDPGDLQCNHYGCQSPIVLDLHGDGFAFTSPARGIPFDIDADGKKEHVSWTEPRGDDAFLCWDRNGNGKIDDGSELFGTATPFLSGLLAPNGYLVLFELDAVYGDSDGYVEASDPYFSDLCLWHDLNQNGHSEPGELLRLDQTGIERIGTAYRLSFERDQHGNELRYRGEAWMSDDNVGERVVPTVDVFLLLDPRRGWRMSPR